MLKLNHKKLEVWKMSISFITDIYKLTESYPKSEIYGLINQSRRTAVSIASNIAEGASRKSIIERKRFYEIARSSTVELDTQLEISLVLGYSLGEELKIISDKINHLFAMLSKLIERTT